LVSEEIDNLYEPALVLTPIDISKSDSDGLLTASEVAKLDLNAEMVVLSACNTASSSGKGNREGLSGLANSFFIAGAKSLLVSHWSVISEAATEITPRLFSKFDKSRSFAHKYRNAVLDIINLPNKYKQDIYKRHPSYWAPFSVIGIN